MALLLRPRPLHDSYGLSRVGSASSHPGHFRPNAASIVLRQSLVQSGVEHLEGRHLFSASPLPRPDHVVVLIEEDHSYSQILLPPIPSPAWAVDVPPLLAMAPNISTFAQSSASFTHAFSVGNSNAIDYQAMFSGLIPKRNDPQPYTAPNIASELEAAGMTFGGYAEGLPHVGYRGDGPGDYTIAHNPWVAFSNVPAADNMPFSRFPHKYSQLPTVSYVVPNNSDNMHSGQVQDADLWFHDNILPYAHWAMSHNSLLIVTWDESHQSNDQIPTIFYGPMVKAGLYGEKITQPNVLRTIEDIYGLAPTGRSAGVSPISDIWKTSVGRRRPTAHATAHGSNAVVVASHHRDPRVFSNTPIR